MELTREMLDIMWEALKDYDRAIKEDTHHRRTQFYLCVEVINLNNHPDEVLERTCDYIYHELINREKTLKVYLSRQCQLPWEQNTVEYRQQWWHDTLNQLEEKLVCGGDD